MANQPTDKTTTTSLTATVAQIRKDLLDGLRSQLDELIVSDITANTNGVPYPNINAKSPQAEAIKKVLNCLYYTEHLLEHIETITSASSWEQIQSIPAVVKAVNQLFDSLALLDDAEPEIQYLFECNYSSLDKLISDVYQDMQRRGYVNKFAKLDKVQKAQYVIDQSISLLGPNVTPEAPGQTKQHALVAAFSKMGEILEVILNIQGRSMTDPEFDQCIELFCQLLLDLDNNPVFKKLTHEEVKETVMFTEFMSWVNTAQEEGIQFTPNSIKKYVTWVNTYLPEFLILTDRLEQQNFLKHRLLSDTIYTNAIRLAEEANKQIKEEPLNIDVAVLNESELAELRSKAISKRQLEILSKLQEIEIKQAATETFFGIIEKYNRHYSNFDLSVISESDREIIAEIYPLIQSSLAHCNLEATNELTRILQLEGPETDKPTVMHSIHGAFAKATYKTTINTLHSLRVPMLTYHGKQVSSERMKLKITEKHREKIKGLNLPESEFENRMAIRIRELRPQLPKANLNPRQARADFKQLGVINLNTMRGAFNYMQQQDYARKIKEYRKLAIQLMLKHIPPEHRYIFMNEPPYLAIPHEPDEVKQFKELLNAMHHMEQILIQFQNLSPNAKMIEQMQFLYRIKDSAVEFQICLTALSPLYKKHISPIVDQLDRIGTNVYTLATREDVPVAPVQEISTTETTNEAPASPPVVPAPYDYSYEIESLQELRQALIDRAQKRLAKGLTKYLKPNAEGMPFTNYANDPPQVQTIKKLINSIYTVEMAYQVWSRKKEVPVTNVDYLVYVQQLIAACTQIYKTLELVNSAPDMQHFIVDNFDILGPVYKQLAAFVETNDLRQRAESTDYAEKSGHFIGKALNLLQPELDKEHHSSPIIQVLYGLPMILNSISASIDKSTEATPGELKVEARKLEALSNVFEYLFTDSGSGLAALKSSGKALSAFSTIMSNLSKENALSNRSTIEAYQKWMKEYYPMILADIDALEVEYNYGSGSLSSAISDEVDKINDRINDVIDESYSAGADPVERILLSKDEVVGEYRANSLLLRKNNVLATQNTIQQQTLAGLHFFNLLENYQFIEPNTIGAEELKELKLLFFQVQLPLANVGFEYDAQLVAFFNNPASNNISIKNVLKLKPAFTAFQNQEKLRWDLKIEVIDQELADLKLLQYPQAPALETEKLPDKAPIELKPIDMSQVHFARGNLSYLQDLKLSTYTETMKNAFSEKTIKYLSPMVLTYLGEKDKDGFYVVKDKDPGKDPNLVRQIKNMENGLVRLNLAFVHFEQMNRDRSMVFQAQAFIHVRQEAVKALDALMKLPPDLKQHYGPLIEDINKFANAIKKFQYDVDDVNKLKAIPKEQLKTWYDDDLAELGLILKGTKEEVLRKNRDRAPRSRGAFFKRIIGDQMTEEERVEWNMEVDQRPVNARDLNKRAAVLTTKYAHMISPEIEKQRTALINAFSTLQSSIPLEFSHLPHEKLGDKEYMKAQVEQLQSALSRRFGYNIKTASSLYKLFRQILRVGSQLDEYGGLINHLVTDEFKLTKEKAYSEVLYSISALEDNLGYKPLLILKNSMAQINQLFLSVAMELDMPFAKKMELFNQPHYIQILIDAAKNELASLEEELKQNPVDASLLLKRDLKQGKITHLETLKAEAQIEYDSEANKAKYKNILLDSMFEVILQRQLEKMALITDIGKEYALHARKLYEDNKATLMETHLENIDRSMHDMMTKFRIENQPNYVLVSKAITSLERLPSRMPDKYIEARTYMTNLVNELNESSTSMFLRAQRVRELPDDADFNTQLNSVEGGPSFLVKFRQFIERVVASLAKAVGGRPFKDTYEHKKINQTLDNVEDTEKKLTRRR